MTQEIRINVDASVYSRPGEDQVVNCDIFTRHFKRVLEKALAEDFLNVSHKFLSVKVNLIPHDNDRDYTEEDAERHLNGEPEKKRKTYAADFFERFPNADRTGGSPSVCRDSVYGIAKECAGRLCGDCWQTAMPDESEDDHA